MSCKDIRTSIQMYFYFNRSLLPYNETSYRGSIWEMHQNCIDEIYEKKSDSIKARYDEYMNLPSLGEHDIPTHIIDDYDTLIDIKNNSFAGLVVSLWSNIEYFLSSIPLITKKKRFKNNKIQNIIDFYKKTYSISLDEIEYYNDADFVRELNNAYKHNNSEFKKNVYTAKKELIRLYFSESNERVIPKSPLNRNPSIRINFSNINLKDLIISCGKFQQNLIDDLERWSINNA